MQEPPRRAGGRKEFLVMLTNWIEWLNENSGGAAIVGAAVSALLGALVTFIDWLGGKAAGKKAAEKAIASLRPKRKVWS